ncbi:uncharacterized protein P884DRAFT_295201 [Thermothelomyces heterothallicus CBS 202.75]|uniref:uncharacterized protein n=1 Tax=Thermothelomyces heterothallicus CBS 202.75 TaxID=1149848 RepID=UPI003743066C
MEGQPTRPALLSKVRGKYGRCDYKRFDNIASTHMRAGRGTIGKVEVDCRFLFTKSQWGVIGEPKNPAGIIYLDLDFSQPTDCRLEAATVIVTLTEDDGEEARIQSRSACPVKFTDHYGPKCIRGPEVLVQTKRVKNGTPEVQVLGYGAGGLGLDKERIVQTRTRWDFSGYISSTKDSFWYNRLRWELKENSLEWQPTHRNMFHTAFALEHNATRFYMTVQVSGKLAKRSDQLKSRLKFGERGGKDEEIVTKIEWAEGYSCPLRLDRIAQDLHEAMEYANMSRVPVEIPSALGATYRPAIASSVPLTGQVQTRPSNPRMGQADRSSSESWPESRPLTDAAAREALGIEPMLEELRRAHAGFAQRPSHRLRPPSLAPVGAAETDAEDGAESLSSVTLVDTAVTSQDGRENSSPAVSESDCQEKWNEKGGEEIEKKPRVQGLWLWVLGILMHSFGDLAGVVLERGTNSVQPDSQTQWQSEEWLGKSTSRGSNLIQRTGEE